MLESGYRTVHDSPGIRVVMHSEVSWHPQFRNRTHIHLVYIECPLVLCSHPHKHIRTTDQNPLEHIQHDQHTLELSRLFLQHHRQLPGRWNS